MAEQAVWRVRRISVPILIPSLPAVRSQVWMIGPPLLLGLLAAFIAVLVQTTAWRSRTEVVFTTTVVAHQPVSVPIPAIAGERRFLEWQASLARSPDLAVRVVRAAGVQGLTAAQFLRHSSATASSDGSDEGVLTLSVTYQPRTAAVRLTNAYATEFVRFKNDVDKRNLREAALRENQASMKGLRAEGLTGIPAFKELVRKQHDLRSGRVSPLSGVAAQLRADATAMRADGATSVRPHALRNGLLGGALGVLLGVALVVTMERRRRPSPGA
jgi:hypothetical protein